MSRIVPSQIVDIIDQMVPAAKNQKDAPSPRFSVAAGGAKGEMVGTRNVWSHGEDATIFGGYGGLVELGWQKVEARLS